MGEDIISVDKWFNKRISISLGKGLIIIVAAGLFYFGFSTIFNHKGKGSGSNDTTGLEIATMIRNVKSELVKADSARIANKEHALFLLKNFSMEITFSVRQVNKGGAKVDYKFVTVEGGSETGNEKVQKLILHWDALEPQPIKVPPSDSVSEMIIVPN